MALPMAVPICIWMASIAPMREGRSIVACWATWALPAKVTMPTSMFWGNSCRNVLAASCAATMRVGLTSFTRMLSDTSIASMIVEVDHGSVTRAVGRARLNSKTDSANQKSAGGMCRRHWRPKAWRATLTLLTRSAGLPRRRSSHRYSAGSKGSASINHRFWGQRKLIYDGRRITAAPCLARATGASAGQPLNTDSGGSRRPCLARATHSSI